MTNLFPLFSGLSGLQSTLTSDWIGPIFLVIVGAVGITFLIKREIRKLIVFLVIAAIVAMLVYASGSVFGQNQGLTNTASSLAGQVNVIVPIVHAHVSNAITSIGNFIH